MNELTLQEIDEIGGGIPLALAGPAITLGVAGFGALGAGVYAGWEFGKKFFNIA